MANGELIFDGDCGFCMQSKQWLMTRMRDGSVATPSQEVAPTRRTALGLTDEDLATAVYWIDANGRPFRGARGIGHALRHCRQPWRALGWILGSAPVGLLAEPVYRLVARYRHRLPGSTSACEIE